MLSGSLPTHPSIGVKHHGGHVHHLPAAPNSTAKADIEGDATPNLGPPATGFATIKLSGTWTYSAVTKTYSTTLTAPTAPAAPNKFTLTGVFDTAAAGGPTNNVTAACTLSANTPPTVTLTIPAANYTAGSGDQITVQLGSSAGGWQGMGSITE